MLELLKLDFQHFERRRFVPVNRVNSPVNTVELFNSDMKNAPQRPDKLKEHLFFDRLFSRHLDVRKDADGAADFLDSANSNGY